MKKLIKFSLALAVVLTTFATYANPADFSLLVKKEEGKTIHFALNTFENMELSLYDANNVVLNTEKLTQTGNINRTYDLNALPAGTYFLKAETNVKTARFEITVTDKTATVSKKSAEVYKPMLINNDGIITMSILNFNESQVAVKIYDLDGVELFDGNFDGKVHFFKKFDLSKIPADKYTFEITYSNQTFTETVATK